MIGAHAERPVAVIGRQAPSPVVTSICSAPGFGRWPHYSYRAGLRKQGQMLILCMRGARSSGGIFTAICASCTPFAAARYPQMEAVTGKEPALAKKY
jgi:ribosomal protein L37E